MSNEEKTNPMGSPVESGYRCKPVHVDSEKPIMHYATHLFVCGGGRCIEHQTGQDMSERLRRYTLELKLDRGDHRVKITRMQCAGACRFGTVGVIYENVRFRPATSNSSLWIRSFEKLDEPLIKKLLLDLSTGSEVAKWLPDEFKLPLSSASGESP